MYYILVDKKAVLVDDLDTWSKWVGENDRQVARTTIDDVYISTVFLGICSSYGTGTIAYPSVFETMIFGGEFDEETKKAHTWKGAVHMHKCLCELVKYCKGWKRPYL